MTMRLRLDQADDDLVAFGCSPAYEALRSLHALTDVAHHPLHISWVLRARTRMHAELKNEAESFAFWCLDGPLVFPEIWSPSDIGSWPDELSALREAPIEAFADQLIHGALTRNGRGRRVPLGAFLRNIDLQGEALARIGARHPASLPVMRELIADPGQCRERFAVFMSSYWQVCLAPDWPSMERHLLADVHRRGRALSRRGPALMLGELSPHIRIEENTGDVVIRPPGRRKDVDPIDLSLAAHDQILLAPSHFVWPELVAVVQKTAQHGRQRLTVLIAYALAEMQQQGQPPAPPEDLLKLLRSAGDATRLQILQLLAGRPRSTREIAGVIGLTEAAISKHLKLLHQAGWIEAERHSYYVYYRLVRDSCDRLTRALEHMLG